MSTIQPALRRLRSHAVLRRSGTQLHFEDLYAWLSAAAIDLADYR